MKEVLHYLQWQYGQSSLLIKFTRVHKKQYILAVKTMGSKVLPTKHILSLTDEETVT